MLHTYKSITRDDRTGIISVSEGDYSFRWDTSARKVDIYFLNRLIGSEKEFEFLNGETMESNVEMFLGWIKEYVS
jgi:hypothetical protein